MVGYLESLGNKVGMLFNPIFCNDCFYSNISILCAKLSIREKRESRESAIEGFSLEGDPHPQILLNTPPAHKPPINVLTVKGINFCAS